MDRYPPHNVSPGSRPGVGHRTISFDDTLAAGSAGAPGMLHRALHSSAYHPLQPAPTPQMQLTSSTLHPQAHPLHPQTLSPLESLPRQQPPSPQPPQIQQPQLQQPQLQQPQLQQPQLQQPQLQQPQPQPPPPQQQHGAADMFAPPPTVVEMPATTRDPGRLTSYTVFQTTNVDPSHPDYQEPIAAALAAAAPPPPAIFNPRSCVTCRRRKVRCDKRMPCSHCVRNKVPCIFPAPGRAPRKPRARDPNGPTIRENTSREAELRMRLRKLEELVQEWGGRDGVAHVDRHVVDDGEMGSSMDHEDDSPSPVNFPSGEVKVTDSALWPPLRRVKLEEVKPPPALMARDSNDTKVHIKKEPGARSKGRHYVSDGIWAKVNAELESIRHATEMLELGDGDDDEDDPDDDDEEHDLSMVAAREADLYSDNHHAFVFEYSSAAYDLGPLRLRSETLMRVWQKYLDNVEVWKRILHVPSTKKVVERAAAGQEVDVEEDALVFSIIYAAVVSLQEDEAKSILGLPKPDLLERYRVAVEQALARAKFLTTSSLTVVQALVMFIGAVATYDDTRFSWSLTAVLVRVALGMGMHRDGLHYSMPPFETEMRRRVWWYIYLVDQRTAEGVGTGPMLRPDSFDTELPSNINDDDISPESTEIPPRREGHSDCAPALSRLRMLSFLRDLAPKALQDTPQATTKDMALTSVAFGEAAVCKMIEDIRRDLLSKCDSSQNQAYLMADLILQIARCRFEMNVMQGILSSAATVSRETRERYFVLAYKIVLYTDLAYTDPNIRQWQWLFRSFPQWSSIAVTLMEAPRLPWSSTMELWWEALHTSLRNMATFGPRGPPPDGGRGDNWMDESKYSSIAWLPLQKLVARVRRHRTAELVKLKANPEAARRAEAQDILRAATMFRATPSVVRRFEELRARWGVLVGIDHGVRGQQVGQHQYIRQQQRNEQQRSQQQQRQHDQQQQQQHHQQQQQQPPNQLQQHQLQGQQQQQPPDHQQLRQDQLQDQQQVQHQPPVQLHQPSGQLSQNQLQYQQGLSLQLQEPQHSLPPNHPHLQNSYYVDYPQIIMPDQQMQYDTVYVDQIGDLAWNRNVGSAGEWVWTQPGFATESPSRVEADYEMGGAEFDWEAWNRMRQ